MRNDSESKKRLFVAVTTLFVIALCIYTFIYRETYNSIKIDTVKIPTVEYGSPNYDLNKLINNPDKYVIDTVIRYCERHKDEEECKNILMLENL